MERPYVIVNCAASLDGKIALANRRPVRLSCDADHQRVHALRAECDAVIVGIGTVLQDDPRLLLDTALAEGESPLRVVLDTTLRTPRSARVLQGDAPTLVATGSRNRRLNVPGEEDLIGAGIHFCATCDGPFYKGEEMLVVGGFEEGLFLTKFETKVTILEVGDTPRASRVLQEQVEKNPRWKFAKTPPFRSSKATGS